MQVRGCHVSSVTEPGILFLLSVSLLPLLLPLLLLPFGTSTDSCAQIDDPQYRVEPKAVSASWLMMYSCIEMKPRQSRSEDEANKKPLVQSKGSIAREVTVSGGDNLVRLME